MHRQLVTPNLDVRAQIYRCLQYVQDAFGSPAEGRPRSAWKAWLGVNQKTNRDFPSGVYFPLWFECWTTVDGVYDNWGHVVIYKDGTCYSSPYRKKNTHDVLGSIEDVERIYGCNFVGWSEDIAGLKVIEGGNMPTEQNVNDYFKTYLNEAPTAEQVGYYTSREWTQLASDVCDRQLKKIVDLESAPSGEFVKAEVYVKVPKPTSAPAGK